MSRLALALALATTLALPAGAQESFVGAHGAQVPATYRGGDIHLDLWPGQAFHMTRGGLSLAGRWHAAGGGIVLDAGAEEIALTVRNATRLRPAGAGEDDDSGDLVTDGALDPATIALPMAGMFTYFADAPVLVGCGTGLIYPVAMEADYPALEAAYLADRPGPAEPLFVTLDVTISPRVNMEGPARPMVTVDRFDATWPGETCERAAARPALVGSVWRIIAMGETVPDWRPPANEPFITLHEGGRFNASVGCNTMMGGFTLDGAGLAFAGPAATMMACPDPLAAQEAMLAGLLPQVAGYAIGGRTLRLTDGTGAVLAELEAVYLP
jgi:copper homeostasis protein (lipoprotein)